MRRGKVGAVPGSALMAALLLVAPLAGQQDPEPTAEWKVLERRPAAGEQCIVCRKSVHDGDIVEVRYKGRRFFVAESMVGEFEARPEHYFEVLKPHSGLFDEEAMVSRPLQSGWLFFGLYVLAGLICGAGCSYVALNRGQPALSWFFAGLLLNLLALATVLSRRSRPSALRQAPPAGLTKIPTTHAPVRCPVCGATNHPSARACGECDHGLHPTIEAETARV